MLVRADVADAQREPDARTPIGTLAPDGTVQTGRGRVRLLELQPAGRRRMCFEEYARGRRLEHPVRITSRPPGTMDAGASGG